MEARAAVRWPTGRRSRGRESYATTRTDGDGDSNLPHTILAAAADTLPSACAAKAPERDGKLAKKRKGKAAKAAELERIKGVELAKTFTALKKMRNDELSDQLKIWKLVEKQTGLKKTTGTRTQLVLALQPLILARFGAKANDLEPGDDGLWGQGLRRRHAAGEGGGKKQKKGKKWVVLSGTQAKSSSSSD